MQSHRRAIALLINSMGGRSQLQQRPDTHLQFTKWVATGQITAVFTDRDRMMSPKLMFLKKSYELQRKTDEDFRLSNLGEEFEVRKQTDEHELRN